MWLNTDKCYGQIIKSALKEDECLVNINTDLATFVSELTNIRFILLLLLIPSSYIDVRESFQSLTVVT